MIITIAASVRPQVWFPSRDEMERLANSGGPMSRTRSDRLFATVLDSSDGEIRCPRVLRIGLDFDGREPVSWARELLDQCGFESEYAARAAVDVPSARYICRPDSSPSPAHVDALTPDAALYQTIMLGLCTAWCYDPLRPVLWTRASLTRRLELFEAEGFYA
jgi:hypothetical protein